MGRREKILVALMAAAIVYGAFELFLAPGSGRQHSGHRPDAEVPSELAGSINSQIDTAGLSPDQERILELAVRPWENNPFYKQPQEKKKNPAAEGETKQQPVYRYLGYLDIGGQKMAIINGLEYKTGQLLESGRAVVRSISPQQVVIQSTRTGEKHTLLYQQ